MATLKRLTNNLEINSPAQESADSKQNTKCVVIEPLTNATWVYDFACTASAVHPSSWTR